MAERAEATERLHKAATQALGIIVEFGDLNSFRNTSDAELGALVIAVAQELARALNDFEAGRPSPAPTEK